MLFSSTSHVYVSPHVCSKTLGHELRIPFGTWRKHNFHEKWARENRWMLPAGNILAERVWGGVSHPFYNEKRRKYEPCIIPCFTLHFQAHNRFRHISGRWLHQRHLVEVASTPAIQPPLHVFVFYYTGASVVWLLVNLFTKNVSGEKRLQLMRFISKIKLSLWFNAPQ